MIDDRIAMHLRELITEVQRSTDALLAALAWVAPDHIAMKNVVEVLDAYRKDTETDD